MLMFGLGFFTCFVFAITSNYLYRKALVQVANSHGSEKILGNWYRISPENNEVTPTTE